MRPVVKIRGQQGQWWVHAGEFGRLPTAHSCCLSGTQYEYDHRARGADRLPGWTKKYEELLAQLRDRKMVVLTKDTEVPNGTPFPDFKRDDYVAVFSIDDLSEVDGRLRFRLVERVAEVQR